MPGIEENHQREQYFFDQRTLGDLADLAEQFANPCCLCTPMLGRELHRRGRVVRVLDVDERFGDLPGFVRWDLYRPRYLDESFDLVICDPPFFNVSLSQLFKAIRMLVRFNYAQKLLVSYLTRRESAVVATFAPFGLQPTGYVASYLTVQESERNTIAFYANWQAPLAAASVASGTGTSP